MIRSRAATATFLVAWAAAGGVVGAGLMRPHWVPLPVSPVDPPADGRPPGDGAGWVANHLLAAECGCSRRILAHLTGRGPLPGVRERIVWVGDGPPDSFPYGFEVECLSAEALAAEYHVEAVPVLVVAAPDGSVRYRGGYTARKQGYDIQDRRLISAVRGGEPAPVLPVYGCATSDRLKAATSLLPPRTRGDAR